MERFNTTQTERTLDSGSDKSSVSAISSMAAMMQITAANRNGHSGPPRNITYNDKPIDAAAIFTPQV